MFYIHNLPSGVTQNMLRRRFQVFGKAEDCKVLICNECVSPSPSFSIFALIHSAICAFHQHCLPLSDSLPACRERCGVIKIRQPGVQRHWRERETAGLRRLTRKRYIDLGNERMRRAAVLSTLH